MTLTKKKLAVYISKFNIESLSNESTKILYQWRLEDQINANPIIKEDTIDEARDKIKSNIENSASEALGKRRINTNRTKNGKPWFTEEVKILAIEKRNAYIKYRNNKTQKEYNKYKEVRNKTNESIRQLKKSYWEKFSKDMEHDLYGGQKRIWNMLRKRKKPVTEKVQINNITPETHGRRT